MATCSAVHNLKLGGELVCDLDEGHETVLRFHFDRLEETEWCDNHVPVSVPYTQTGPLKKLKVEVPA